MTETRAPYHAGQEQDLTAVRLAIIEDAIDAAQERGDEWVSLSAADARWLVRLVYELLRERETK